MKNLIVNLMVLTDTYAHLRGGDSLKMIGGGRNISCGVNHTVECPSGTQDCYDESPVYCKKMVGGEKNITCGGNKTVGCPSGTRDCYDNSTVYCK